MKQEPMQPVQYADLEIVLSRLGGLGEQPMPRVYGVELRFTQPGSDADVRIGGRQASTSSFDLERLAELVHDHPAYGRALGDGLFAAAEVAEGLARARTAAQTLGVALRLRLAIAGDAPELHALRWELLRLPDGVLASASEQVLFSRYLASVDWNPVKLRPRASLRALVVVAASTQLASYGLAPIDGAAELARVHEVLQGVEIVSLAEPGHANITAILEHLRDGFDLLYLWLLVLVVEV